MCKPDGAINLKMEIYAPMCDPDGVGVSKGIGFLYQCATLLGSVSREVEIFAPMFDPAGVDELLDDDFCTNV